MELTHLRYFYNVAKTRSFSQGARLSHVTPPAVSKAVRKLEDELGTPLFMRTTRSTALTPSGEILFEHCRDLFDCVLRMERALEAASTALAGPLRIGAMEVFSVFLLPVALCRLVHEHPEVVPSSFELLPPELERHVLDGEIDVGFTVGAASSAGVVSTTLGTTPGVLVCGREHPLFGRARIGKKELAAHPFVVPRFLGSEHLPPIDQFPEARQERQIGATIELLQMGIQMTISGAFLGYFPEVSVRQQIEDGSLHRLKGLAPGPPFELCAITRKKVPPKAAAQRLVEQVRALVRPS